MLDKILAYESGIFSEAELLKIRKRINNTKDLELRQKRLKEFYDKMPEDGYRITSQQTEKGLTWLIDQWKTPRGIERKNNPFGYREQNVLENFSYFTINNLYDTATHYATQIGTCFYIPVYTVHSKDGGGFEYYVSGGETNIIG